MTTWTHSPNEESSTWRYHTSQICRDGSGNIYSTIKIGNQEWMAENLKTTKYNDGTAITFVDDEDADVEVWEDLTTGAYSQGGTGTTADDDYEDTYGYLYNGYAVDTGKLAPEGWHVPTDTELTTLTDYLGSDAGSKLAGNADLWTNGSLDSNSEFGTSGFTGLPGGYRNYNNGNYYNLGNHGYFWSSTEKTIDVSAWYRLLSYNYSTVFRYGGEIENGYSVRCVRDKSTWNTLKGGVWNLGSLIAWEDLDKHNWEDWN